MKYEITSTSSNTKDMEACNQEGMWINDHKIPKWFQNNKFFYQYTFIYIFLFPKHNWRKSWKEKKPFLEITAPQTALPPQTVSSYLSYILKTWKWKTWKSFDFLSGKLKYIDI